MADEEERWIEDGDDVKKRNGDDEEDDEDEEFGGSSLFGDSRGEFELDFENGIKVCLKGIKAKYPMFLQSTGLTLWQSSKNLCSHLCENPHIVRNKSVIELGAGLGLAGIVAFKLGAERVVLTDGDTDTLDNMRENVSLNTKSSIDSSEAQNLITCKQLRWGRHVEEFRTKWTQDKGFDVVMGSDIIYAKEYIEVLFQSISILLSASDDAIFLLSHMKRNPTLSFDSVFECAKENGFQWSAPDGEEGMYTFYRRK